MRLTQPGRRGLFVAVAAILMSIALLAAPAGALPPGGGEGCYPECGTPRTPPPPPPANTTITQISPGFGWSGDTMRLTGVRFTGASVTVNGQAATVLSRTDTAITFVVPTINSTVVGPVQVPVVVSGPSGSASTSFMLSPTLTVSAGATFGVNSQFGQGMDGSASATVDIDRASGFVHGHTVVRNTQFWLSLTINVSAALLDSTGTVVGFTAPQPLTSTGVFWHWPTGDTTATSDWITVTGPNAGVGPLVSSARLLLVRDHDQELLSTLNNAVATGQTIASVITTLAGFMV